MNNKCKPKGLNDLLAEDDTLLKKVSYDQLNKNLQMEMDISLKDAYRAYCQCIDRNK